MKQLTPKDKRVLKVINDNPGSQNDDAKLLEVFWKSEGWNDDHSLYWNLSRVTPAESVTRSRRALHELGYIKYSKDADKAREDRYKQELEERSDGGAVSWLYD